MVAAGAGRSLAQSLPFDRFRTNFSAFRGGYPSKLHRHATYTVNRSLIHALATLDGHGRNILMVILQCSSRLLSVASETGRRFGCPAGLQCATV